MNTTAELAGSEQHESTEKVSIRRNLFGPPLPRGTEMDLGPLAEPVDVPTAAAQPAPESRLEPPAPKTQSPKNSTNADKPDATASSIPSQRDAEEERQPNPPAISTSALALASEPRSDLSALSSCPPSPLPSEEPLSARAPAATVTAKEQERRTPRHARRNATNKVDTYNINAISRKTNASRRT